ncbi:MAG TPA: CerR family C-terminal domain-containing protein [Roseiarcus sp.]|nr:CerR family C-terminal domain-containing protein [Roseiarcus sp.]
MSRVEALASPRSESTRAALLAAALNLFGAKGFEGTSTREIAAAAGANVASIAYHFGGKEGLRIACADHVVATVGEIFAGAVGRSDEPKALSPAAARDRLAQLVEGMIDAIVARDAARPIARFVLREMFEPSAAFERLYAGAFAPIHARACQIWARAASAEPESEATRLAVFAMIAQIIYFRLARPAVLRRMGWRDIGAAQSAAIKRIVVGNVDATLGFKRKSGP